MSEALVLAVGRLVHLQCHNLNEFCPLQVWPMQSDLPDAAENGRRPARCQLCENELQQVQQGFGQSARYARGSIRSRLLPNATVHLEPRKPIEKHVRQADVRIAMRLK